MTDSLTSWVQAASGRQVLLLGDLILDRYIYGDAERISPEAPVPVIRTVEKRDAVGGSANVAACLAALGCRVHCGGIIGRDRHGARLAQLLTDLGANVDAVVELEGRPTTTKTRLVGLAQHRHRQQLLRVDEEETGPIPQEALDALLAGVSRVMSTVDVVCIEDYDKGVISEALVTQTIEHARRARKPVLVDPARLRDYGRYAGADFITPNRQELSIACGATFETLEDLAEATTELLQQIEVGAAIATVDRDGAVLVLPNGDWRHFPTTPRSVYDNTGAGDAVLAALAAAMAAGAPAEDAVRIANLAGGLEVERFGCVPITSEELLAEIRLSGRANGKVKSAAETVAELNLRRDRGETVVFTNGCFDLLHAGHVDFLTRCRREGSVLVVGLNSDASVRGQGKGEDRPINRFEHRAAVLSALECVDYVVGFETPTPEELIQTLRPDVLVKGRDWEGQAVAGGAFVERHGGRVMFLDLVDGLSTTTLIDRIRRSTS